LAVKLTPIVAKEVTGFLLFLKKTEVIKFDNVHLIGLSLGAQIAGAVGYNILQQTNKKLAG